MLQFFLFILLCGVNPQVFGFLLLLGNLRGGPSGPLLPRYATTKMTEWNES